MLFLVSWMLVGAMSRAADEIEPLDADFLEYLANMEDEDDDWTLLEDAPRKTADGEQAKKAETRKPSKEAAKPAVDER
ncbi:hypothetical protein [Peristeroidobacter soli]|jgi:hypothetical protein|uniref:hypothetical protein n=1 Tax=Peristeroidobacter soli TaxID=2497877 RepID=UPI00101D43C9|nr:hypothetical protein [Peristeroidobacter soli]